MLKKVILLMLVVLVLFNCYQKEKRKILYYVNPMDPSIKSDKPMKDPMGMDYIPIYEDEANNEDKNENKYHPDGYTAINIPYQKQQLIGVKLGTVEKKEVKITINGYGRILHDPDLYNLIQEYYNALSHYNEVVTGSKENISTSKLMLDSIKSKLNIAGFTEYGINELSKDKTIVNSLLTNNSSSKIWALAFILESDSIYITPSMNVTVTLPSLPDYNFNGKIISVDPVLDKESRSVKIRILFDSMGMRIPHDTYLNVKIYIPMGKKVVIDEDAIFYTGTRNIVFVAKDEGYFEPREVNIGRKFDGFYEVISGVNENEKVVTSANFLIDSESQLKASLSQM